MASSLTEIFASEDGIVERPALALLQELGRSHVDVRDELQAKATRLVAPASVRSGF